MSGCDVVINTTICGNSAVDKVASLMASGVGLNEACKQVAAETDKEHGTTTKWTAVKKKVQRANQLGTVSPPKKKLVPLDVPMVDNSTTDCVIDTTKYITIEEHRAVLAKVISDFEEVIATLSEKESVIVSAPVEKISKGIPRQKVFEFVQKHGNEIQCTVLKDEHLTNEKLFKVFVKVREQYKTSTPPPAWDKEIVDAEFIQ